jgi:hypothetical protein
MYCSRLLYHFIQFRCHASQTPLICLKCHICPWSQSPCPKLFSKSKKIGFSKVFLHLLHHLGAVRTCPKMACCHWSPTCCPKTKFRTNGHRSHPCPNWMKWYSSTSDIYLFFFLSWYALYPAFCIFWLFPPLNNVYLQVSYIHCFNYIMLGFWVAGFQVSGNLETNGNHVKPGNYFTFWLMLVFTASEHYLTGFAAVSVTKSKYYISTRSKGVLGI